MPPGDSNSTRYTRIVVTTQGETDVKKLANSIGGLNKTIKETNGFLSTFKNIFNAALGFSVAGIGISTITSMADSMQNLNNRINVLSSSTEAAQNTMEGLLEVANRTKTSVDSLATIYVRLAASTKESGISSEALLSITETLQNTFRLSGATIQEATNAAIQLSQGFASGQLRGQELRSVLEQNVVFGDLLSKSLGKTRGEIYKMAEAGQLTSSVVLKAMAEGTDEVNEKASKLSATFEQSLTVAFNRLKFAINEVNKDFGISSKFAAGIDLISEKFTLLAAVITTILVPALIGGLYAAMVKIGTASIAFMATPVGAIITALSLLGVGVVLAVKNLDSLIDIFKIGFSYAERFSAEVEILGSKFRDLVTFGARTEIESGIQEGLELRIESLTNYIGIQKEYLGQRRKNSVELDKINSNELKNELDKGNKESEFLEKRLSLLAKLNKAYQAGKLGAGEYYNQLETIDRIESKRLFLSGKRDLEQYNTERRKLTESELNRSVAEGTTSLEEFNKAVNENQLETLNEKFAAGKIAVQEYDEQLNKLSQNFTGNPAFRQGITDYLNSIGTVSQGIAGVITKTFSSLEDAIVEFTQKGKADMGKFAQAILDDLTRILVRYQIVAPLARGLLESGLFGLGGVGSGGGASLGGAAGIGQTALPFAKGGVVDQMTPFYFGNGGRLGVAGEAGPEAILPLRRTSNGELGVQSSSSNTVVNIINNSGGEVEQRETTGAGGEKQLDIIIHSKVRDGIASGQFDKTFQSSFGLKRRGT